MPSDVTAPELVQVDSFTDRPFAGNPAAVCLLAEPRDEAWMQSVAAEMNLSETAFLLPRPGASGEYDLRWFTPAVEVDLCGHATLASAHVLWERGRAETSTPLDFHTRSGLLTAHHRGETGIEMDFPTQTAEVCDPPAGLIDALGLEMQGTREAQWVGRNQTDYLVELVSETAVRETAPDFRGLAAVESRGVIVTAPADGSTYDFVSRFFAPAAGIDEDPVTGSAHCCLAPFWESRLGKNQMTGYQASARGGVVGVRVDGDRVRLLGKAVTVFRTLLAC